MVVRKYTAKTKFLQIFEYANSTHSQKRIPPLGGAGGGFRWFSRRTLVDFQNRICGLTEPFLRIQLVAEGSSSTWRAFGVAMAKARRVNVEGSAFQ